MDIVCLGELILDMFASEMGKDFFSVSAFVPVAGGAPANVAVAAARQGVKSAFIGKVGEDAFGHRLEKVLQGYGVETRGMRFDANARTTLNFMTLLDPNRTEMLFYRNPGADQMLRPRELDQELLKGAAVYHFGSVSLASEPCRSATLIAAGIARTHGALVSFDVNYRPSLWDAEKHAVDSLRDALRLADIVKVNEVELRMLSGLDNPEAGCKKIVERGPALCTATLGPAGSAFATSSASGSAPGLKVDVVDATGCGDAFMASLLVKVLALTNAGTGKRRARLAALDARTLIEILNYANAAGALTALKKGVMNALPDTAEIEAVLQTRK